MRRLLLAAAFVAAASTAVLAQRPGRPHLQVDVTKSVICPLSEKAAEGDKVTVHYGGFLMDGKKFDSSFDRAKPFTFDLGVGQVIPGWDQGLIGVCKNEERHLVVPASLAYGDRGAGDVIPAGATLLFDIVVVDVQKIKSAADVRQEEEDTRRKAAAEADRRQREEEDKKRVEDNRRRDEEDRRRAEAAEAEADRRRQQDEDDNKRRRQDAADRRRQQEEDDNKRRKQQLEAEKKKEAEQNREPEYEYEDYPAEQSTCPAGRLDTRIQFQPQDCSRKAREGDKLRMHYVGKLLDGTKFDSSIDRNKPFDFTLGVGQVIQGWDAGVLGMCVSEKRTLVVPADMAYGEAGVGNVIPSCATLVFDVLLLSIDS